MTNRMDNMTKEERIEAFRQADKIRTNHIIGACCSVDDLRCTLRNLDPETPIKQDEAVTDLKGAIAYEEEHQKRVTVIKMLTAKMNSINKKLPW